MPSLNTPLHHTRAQSELSQLLWNASCMLVITASALRGTVPGTTQAHNSAM